jgi:hypothetical protein
MAVMRKIANYNKMDILTDKRSLFRPEAGQKKHLHAQFLFCVPSLFAIANTLPFISNQE